jgi:phosphatidylserine decarboxylase
MAKHITSLISQNFAKFANKEFPTWFQNIVNKSYVSLMGLDMSEFNDATSYKTLNALFTRRLNNDREFSLDEKDFISPCDSLISECGELKKDYALQIKGMKYSSDELLGEHFTQDEKELIHDGSFINFYLSPKDYHRYHIPIDLEVLKVVHIPGKLYPVNFPSLRNKVNLFIENERVVLKCKSANDKIFYMVLVGALNVGVMQVAFEPNIKTNVDAQNSTMYEYNDMKLKKGDDFGCFEMGSTIVILAQKDMLEFENLTGENVRYAQTIAKVI